LVWNREKDNHASGLGDEQKYSSTFQRLSVHQWDQTSQQRYRKFWFLKTKRVDYWALTVLCHYLIVWFVRQLTKYTWFVHQSTLHDAVLIYFILSFCGGSRKQMKTRLWREVNFQSLQWHALYKSPMILKRTTAFWSCCLLNIFRKMGFLAEQMVCC